MLPTNNIELKIDSVLGFLHNLPMSSTAEIRRGLGLEPVAPLKTGYYLGKKGTSAPA